MTNHLSPTGTHRSSAPLRRGDTMGTRSDRGDAFRSPTDRWRHSDETLAPHHLQICAGIWREFSFVIYFSDDYCELFKRFTWISWDSNARRTLLSAMHRKHNNGCTFKGLRDKKRACYWDTYFSWSPIFTVHRPFVFSCSLCPVIQNKQGPIPIHSDIGKLIDCVKKILPFFLYLKLSWQN